MYYPGDFVVFVLPLQHSDGAAQLVTSVPKITILNAADGTTTLASTVMTLLAGATYKYSWDTADVADGCYVAFVSYVADALVVQDKFLGQIQLGDSRVTGLVALDETVAKDATVAKNATVLHVSDYTAPDEAALVLAIKGKLDSLPANIASEATLQQVLTIAKDIDDATEGSLVVDKNAGRLSLMRKDGSVLATFQLSNTDEQSSRTRL